MFEFIQDASSSNCWLAQTTIQRQWMKETSRFIQIFPNWVIAHIYYGLTLVWILFARHNHSNYSNRLRCIANTFISFHIVSSIVWSTNSQSYFKFWCLGFFFLHLPSFRWCLPSLIVCIPAFTTQIEREKEIQWQQTIKLRQKLIHRGMNNRSPASPSFVICSFLFVPFRRAIKIVENPFVWVLSSLFCSLFLFNSCLNICIHLCKVRQVVWE